ncbi:MAG: hypothetical protein BGO34_10195 [Bacteroidia bacterium 44-10]|nr:MAG: hypothetical protein BGO34_10195 [Bacteroidia bacterium 44-10]
MTNTEKRESLESQLNDLIRFKTKLTADNLDEFNNLTKDILELLDDNQKLRFNQINFYNIAKDRSNIDIDIDVDDLPF